MAQASGLGPWPLPELSRKLAGKQASISSWATLFNRGFDGYAVSGDLRSLFEMAYLGFTDVRIDPVAVQAMMEQYKTSLAHRGDDPQTVFGDEINRTLYGNLPLFKPLELADLPKADIDTALAYIRKGLNPADYTFVFTGNLNPEIMKNYVETYIASIPPLENNWNTLTDPGFTRPGKIEKIVHKGKEEQSSVYMAWFSPSPFTEERIAAARVLGEYLDIIMTEQIREKLGGVYSIWTGAGLIPVPRTELYINLSFDCDPKRVQELSGAVIDILRQTAAADGINRDTFDKSVEALKKGWETSMQDNVYISEVYLSSAVMLDLPLSRLHRQPEYYNAVTPEDIQQLCAQILQDGPAQVVLLPE
jgi:zinc protease